MKKTSILTIVAIAIGFASCTSRTPKADLKTDLDSLAYAIGMAQSSGLKNYLVGNANVDTAYMSEFIRGLNEGVKKTTPQRHAYLVGLQIGQQIQNQMLTGLNREIFGGDTTRSINQNNFMAGFVAGTTEKNGLMTSEEALAYAEANMESIKAKTMETQFAENKAAGAQFLADNKLKEGVVTTPSGLQYRIITKGTGPIPTDGSVVRVNYVGRLIDGTEFDSSYKRGEPAVFGVDQVIKGWTEALKMMPVGSKWELFIPEDLGYGANASGQIQPFSTLIFEVELLGIEQ